jgi:large subunit ribosomal protein L22
MEAKAIQKYTLTSPQKLREVVYMIRKMSPIDAIERLPFTHKRAADSLSKVIKAAVANARQKGANDSELVFKEIEINEGPRLRRFRAGARGRAKPYKKRMSHIRVVLETKTQPKVETVAKQEEVKSVEGKVQKVEKKETVRSTVKKGSKKA